MTDHFSSLELFCLIKNEYKICIQKSLILYQNGKPNTAQKQRGFIIKMLGAKFKKQKYINFKES